MSAPEILSVALMTVGALLLLLAAVGIVRMPDLFLRMSATSKASSLGAGCALLAVAVSSDDASVAWRALAGVAFQFLTTPVAAHMIGRAAYLSGAPLWPGTVCDDLRGRYDGTTHRLSSEPADAAANEPPPSGG